jgi:hypothetical protein
MIVSSAVNNLHKEAYKKENSCFIDRTSLRPIDSQWDFLQSIKKISIDQLDKAYHTITNEPLIPAILPKRDKLHIVLNNKVHISRDHLPLVLSNFLNPL